MDMTMAEYEKRTHSYPSLKREQALVPITEGEEWKEWENLTVQANEVIES